MKIDKIHVEGFGPIVKFSTSFKAGANAIIGLNGCGKTHLLRAIAGVCGTDDATMLLSDFPVGKLSISVINNNGRRHTFKCKGSFDLEAVRRFKAKLSERVNFPSTQWSVCFPSKVIDPYEARDRFVRMVGDKQVTEMFRPVSNGVHNTAGAGFTRMLNMFFGDGADGVPTLLEFPEQRLDLMNKRLMLDELCSGQRQVIFSTHAPEMIPQSYSDPEALDGVIDMSPRQ